MSGLFAFRSRAVDLDRLKPVGFKLLLEILVRHPRPGSPRSLQLRPAARGGSKAVLRRA